MAEYNPQQMPELIPSIAVRDTRQTLEWFGKLGFAPMFTMPLPDGSLGHAHVVRKGAHIMFGPDGCVQAGAGGMQLYINIGEDVDAYCQRVRQAGVDVTREPEDQFWGDRTFEVTHPDGYKLTFFQHVRDVSEEEMQRAMSQMMAAGASA